MDRQETFNHIFDSGFAYSQYVNRSDRHAERMKSNYSFTEELVDELTPNQKEEMNRSMKVLCIAENWCGDCGHAVPVISRLAEEFSNWNFRIAARDEFTKEIDMFYTTAGRKKIPIIIFADVDGDEISRWVERPKRSYKAVSELKNKKMKKEDFMATYKSLPELRPPSLTKEIFKELFDIAEKASCLVDILPTKSV